MRLLKQSTAASVMVFMTDSSDHVTGKAGLTLTITASKNGAAFGSISPTVNDRGSGWYEIQLTTGHTDTLGDLALHVTSTGADPTDTLSYVVVRHLADLAFPATSGRSLAVETDGMIFADIREWLGTAPLALSSQRVQALMGAITAGIIDAAAIGTGAIDADAIAAGAITSSEAPALANLDVAVSTRSSHTAADAATAVWAAGTRTLSSFGTLVSDVATAVWAAGTRTLTGFGTLISDIWNNATRTLTASLDPTAAQIRSEIDTNSTQLAAIKTQTDNLPSGIARNTALANFTFLMVDSSDHVTPKTGLTVSGFRSLDGAAFAGCANSPSEVGFGVYKINLAAGDLDAAVVTLRFTATGADARVVTIVTEPEVGT